MSALRLIDVEDLQYVADRHAAHKGLTAPYDGYVRHIPRAHRLVRLGYLSRERHSEHVRGERRFYWWCFRLTNKGRSSLGGPHPSAKPKQPAPATAPATPETTR